jgi:uridine kinase
MLDLTLNHYGVKGMKWGVRKDNKQSSLKIKSGRLNLFGSPGHNVLYIAGVSGSGKSTLALNLSKKLNAELIHLDWYYDGRKGIPETPFKKFIKDNGVDVDNLYNGKQLNYKESDKIFPLIQEYYKKRRLIVEGVQLLDQTMSAENINKILIKEPILSVQTSTRISYNRARERDQSAVNFIEFQKA